MQPAIGRYFDDHEEPTTAFLTPDGGGESGWQAPAQRPMFIDAQSMKEKLRENMIKPQYDVSNFYKTTGFCQKVARSSTFEHTTLAVIGINALWMSIDTDVNTASMLLLAHPVFQIAEHFFCAYFAFEWTMRFGAFKLKRNGLRDAWFVFDSFMMVMMVGETWVMQIVLLATGVVSGGGAGMGDASILRLLRLMRLSRMARMAKLLRRMPELLILIKGMMTAMKSVIYTLMLLGILIYVFAVAMRQLTDGTCAGKTHFASIPGSMHTLLLDGALMDSPGNVVTDLLKENVALVIVFYVFVCLAALMVMNMLIGVLCEVVSAVALTEKEQIAVNTVKDGFMAIIEQGGLDTDGDKRISQAEFKAILDNPDAIRLLDSVNVDVIGLVDLADFIFARDDDDSEEEKTLDFGEFMEIVLSLRGTNVATVKDITDLRKFIKNAVTHLEEKLFRPTLFQSNSKERLVSKVSSMASNGTATSKEDLVSTIAPQTPRDEAKLFARPRVPTPLQAQKRMGPLMLQQRRPSEPNLPSPQQDLVLNALQLEGVLSGAQHELARFMEGVLPTRDKGVNADQGHTGQLTPDDQACGLSEAQEAQRFQSQMVKLGQALSTGINELRTIQHRMAA